MSSFDKLHWAVGGLNEVGAGELWSYTNSIFGGTKFKLLYGDEGEPWLTQQRNEMLNSPAVAEAKLIMTKAADEPIKLFPEAVVELAAELTQALSS